MKLSKKITAGASLAALAVAGGAVVLPTAAFAQSAATTSSRDTITVTAQRREENLQEVPVAITALSTEDLENRQVRDVLDLQSQVPNISISNGTGTGNSARFFFRGVGEDESRGAIDPAVGVYIDGIYLGRTVGSVLDVVDVERIEVLRGPQGTLYGRNSNGGAIKLVSVRPQNENSIDAQVGFGSDSRAEVRAVGNLAMGEDTALRVSSLYKRRDGFHTVNPNGDFADEAREVGEEDVMSFRGSLKHDFSDAWMAMLTLDYTEDNSEPTPSSIVTESDDPAVVTDRDQNLFTVEPAPSVTCSSFVPGIFQPIGCFTDFNSEVESFGAAFNVEGQLGSFDVMSLTGFRTLNDDLASHITFPFFQNTDQEQFSQEVTLTSNFEGALNFLIGAYYYRENVRLDSTFVNQFRVAVDTESLAFFGQATLDITDSLSLTGGLRYTDEERDYIGENMSPGVPGFGRVDSINSDNVQWTVKADYAFTDNFLVYGSYATGFKSAGFSPDCFSPAACFLPVAEEEVKTWEAGFRSQLFEERLRFNATYFYNTYDDLQISASVPGLGFTRSNAGAATIQGVELEGNLFVTENFEIYGNASWLDAEYDELTLTQAGTLTNNGAACPGGVVTIECGLALDLKAAPKYKATVGFLFDADFRGGVLTIGGDAAYEDESFALVSNQPGSLVDPGVTFNARVSYQPDDGPWRISFWGKNLSDREYFRASTNANGLGNQAYAVPPLTWGVDIGVSF